MEFESIRGNDEEFGQCVEPVSCTGEPDQSINRMPTLNCYVRPVQLLTFHVPMERFNHRGGRGFRQNKHKVNRALHSQHIEYTWAGNELCLVFSCTAPGNVISNSALANLTAVRS